MDGYQFFEGVYVYFVTFTVVDWLPIFIHPEPIHNLIDSLVFCINEKFLRVHAYVIMPNHVHLVVFDAKFDNSRLQRTLAEFRKFTGHKLADYIELKLPESYSALIRGHYQTDRIRLIWKRGWHAEGLGSEAFLRQKVNYLHDNPVRKGYVRSPEHWRYSSAGCRINWEEGDIPISLVIAEEDMKRVG